MSFCFLAISRSCVVVKVSRFSCGVSGVGTVAGSIGWVSGIGSTISVMVSGVGSGSGVVLAFDFGSGVGFGFGLDSGLINSGVGIGVGSGVGVWVGSGGNRVNCLSPPAANSDSSLAIATSLLIISALALVSSSLTVSNSDVRDFTFPRLPPPQLLNEPRYLNQ